MQRISEGRFNAIAGYARRPMAAMFARELEFYEADGGRIVGLLVEDRTDQDYAGTVFAPDARGRYRSVRLTDFVATHSEARELLEREMAISVQSPPDEFFQGDEVGRPVDFFTPVRAHEELNPNFVVLADQEGYTPARDIILPMMRWYEDADGNFIEQFQTSGFDQRIWELYLFATFIEAGYELDRAHAVPDFICNGLLGSFTVEAVTVGPTRVTGQVIAPPPMDTEEQRLAFFCDYMPIKFGSPLYSKLKKKYWKQPHVADKPFLLAIHDFSSPGSMVFTRSALETYAFGYSHEPQRAEDGTLAIVPKKIEEHKWEDKAPVPSGFFRQPDSENVSAIIFSNSGTIAKFNRMGILHKFGPGNVLAVREGTMVNHDPNASLPKHFKVLVNSAGYEETWMEGMSVLHNPNAIYPFDPNLLPGAAHLFLEPDGQVTSLTPDFFPLGSITRHWAPVDVAEALEEIGDKTHAVWTLREEAS